MEPKTKVARRVARRGRGSLDAFIAQEMRNPEFRIHFQEARAKSDIAHALAQARKRAGLTQAEVARRAGTTQSVIGRLEGGTLRMPSLPLIARVARALEMELTIGLVRPS
ncbi:MAG: helix-turn-helix transcriptional regulator [Candidatus Rokubacteria bacterium]|nr:helix-turn-helix transcriptional regulator [Candidatus Rokubacteria bacterium]